VRWSVSVDAATLGPWCSSSIFTDEPAVVTDRLDAVGVDEAATLRTAAAGRSAAGTSSSNVRP
jgi:hypothetical protein